LLLAGVVRRGRAPARARALRRRAPAPLGPLPVIPLAFTGAALADDWSARTCLLIALGGSVREVSESDKNEEGV
jgi:hypothetical protein